MRGGPGIAAERRRWWPGRRPSAAVAGFLPATGSRGPVRGAGGGRRRRARSRSGNRFVERGAAEQSRLEPTAAVAAAPATICARKVRGGTPITSSSACSPPRSRAAAATARTAAASATSAPRPASTRSARTTPRVSGSDGGFASDVLAGAAHVRAPGFRSLPMRQRSGIVARPGNWVLSAAYRRPTSATADSPGCRGRHVLDAPDDPQPDLSAARDARVEVAALDRARHARRGEHRDGLARGGLLRAHGEVASGPRDRVLEHAPAAERGVEAALGGGNPVGEVGQVRAAPLVRRGRSGCPARPRRGCWCRCRRWRR